MKIYMQVFHSIPDEYHVTKGGFTLFKVLKLRYEMCI